MTELRFTHLTTKKPVSVTRELAFGVMPAESLGGTYILSAGGAIMPVSESVDQVRSAIWGEPATSSAVKGSQAGKNKPIRRG